MPRVMIFALFAALAAQPLAAQQAAQPSNTSARAAEAKIGARAGDVLAVLTGAKPAGEVFAPAFLAQVSAEQLAALTAQLTTAHGPLRAIEIVQTQGANAAAIRFRFERAVGRGTLTIEPQAPHRVAGLLIQGVEPIGDDLDTVRRELIALPGQVNAWFGPIGGKPVLALGADRSLALGSTFKLYVLAALQRAVREGPLRWDSIVRLDQKSYPSGLTQQWPRGTPVTVQSLATLMIQISDNTATDQLITLLGRDRIEAELRRTNPAAPRSLPFLTTREMFVIKADPELRARYGLADQQARRAVLAEAARRDPPLAVVSSAFAGQPLAIDTIEWFADPPSLARLMETFTGDDAAVARGILSANSGLGADAPPGWAYLGFKGGSEPGVLNLTWLLRDKGGRWHMATLGWNNPDAPIAQDRLVALGRRMLMLAPGRPAP